ncbi:hypothetical protein CJ179_30205 [Rhodococcus sp. ACS1]|uniref:Uncharacterized protein n=1 Tax=Rhodococcus koreensis TaxID=99653 RepID=A0A1H5BVP0_9NOCA|nr:hypothetical protein CJ179_30205 [Rhodococcus sp. ACS1]SED58456.1 hypothetical protein SAMN04490239_8873 [Rhodococcus koreensis]
MGWGLTDIVWLGAVDEERGAGELETAVSTPLPDSHWRAVLNEIAPSSSRFVASPRSSVRPNSSSTFADSASCGIHIWVNRRPGPTNASLHGAG